VISNGTSCSKDLINSLAESVRAIIVRTPLESHPMAYEDLIVLIPSHSLEDFPTEANDAQAASLLNSFVVPWHPQLIAEAGVIPRWHRADTPPEISANRLIMLPTKCTDLVPHGWVDQARRDGATVVADLTDRNEMLTEALKPLDVKPVNADLAADFLALGFCYLQIELLTRHMRHYGSADEIHFQREAVAAAQAAVANDEATAKTRLKVCFELLTEARERFHPTDCYLLDLCLLIPRLADQHLSDSLLTLKPMSIALTGQDVDEIAKEHPEQLALLKEAWQRKSVAIVGGEYREGPSTLLPLNSLLWQFEKGRELYAQHLGRKPTIWGRRRFGLMPPLPQILHRSGYIGGMHVALDDGFYPDQEFSKIRWEGTAGQAIDSITRIPLAADSANSYLRFPVRMSESMDNDQVAAVLFARWPETKSPWFEDLRRMQNYSPVLGRFVTLEDFFEHTDSASRLSTYDPNEYLSPYFVQAVARMEADPGSRHAQHFSRRQRFDSAAWCAGLTAALRGLPVRSEAARNVEQTLEQSAPEGTAEQAADAENQLRTFEEQAGRALGELITHGGGKQPGVLLVNTLGFPRLATVELGAHLNAPPLIEGPVKFVQWDAHHKAATIEFPGSGFVWLSKAAQGKQTPTPATPLAEPYLLRNDFFEVLLSESTGGLRQLKNYGRSPNRLSQQLSYRFPRERKIPDPDPDAHEIKTYYAEMRGTGSTVTSAGPSLGEVVTKGEIVDQTNGQKLADFAQTFRVWRGRPVLEIDVELSNIRMPDGDPWSNYIAVRFAWNSSMAALTRSVLGGAQTGWKDERLETPLYLEIADDDQRTTILTHGMPFHRKAGERMLDSILVVAGETRKKFQFTIAVDQAYPMQAALDAITPITVIPTEQGPPKSGSSGWFFHLNVRNVQIVQMLDLQENPVEVADAWDSLGSQPDAVANVPVRKGFCLRLLETEGRPVRAIIKCFRTPLTARQRDFQGRTVTDLTVRDDSVQIDIVAHEIAEVEFRW
jgi:alpha-mannosidase